MSLNFRKQNTLKGANNSGNDKTFECIIYTPHMPPEVV